MYFFPDVFLILILSLDNNNILVKPENSNLLIFLSNIQCCCPTQVFEAMTCVTPQSKSVLLGLRPFAEFVKPILSFCHIINSEAFL